MQLGLDLWAPHAQSAGFINTNSTSWAGNTSRGAVEACQFHILFLLMPEEMRDQLIRCCCRSQSTGLHPHTSAELNTLHLTTVTSQKGSQPLKEEVLSAL